MEWSEDKCLQLVDAYREKRLLWDSKHPQHYHKWRRKKAWHDIADLMQTDSESCRRKITTLQASFRREKAKVKKSAANGTTDPDELYSPTWFAYERLKFLCDKDMLPAETNNKAVPEENNSQEDEQHLQEDYGALDTLLKEEDLGCFDDTDADVNVEDTNSNTDSMPTASNIDSTPTASDQTGIRPRPTLARKRPATTTVQHKPETVQSKVQRVPDFCREDDEFDLFGKSIAVQLRNMPLERALVCQETLQAVMKQERLYQLHHMS